MANPLTGDYDALVQIAVRQINALLATLHQNSAAPDVPLKPFPFHTEVLAHEGVLAPASIPAPDPPLRLPHSVSMRVGDPRRRPPEVDAFDEWVVAYQKAHTPVAVADLLAGLTGTAPPGAARLIDAAFNDLAVAVSGVTPPDPVRGRADLQISSPTLSLPAGSTSEVTIHAHIRAHYRPDKDTTEMPEPVHGEVRAVFDMQKVQSPTGRRLRIQPSAQDSKIQFIPAPGSGLSAADAGRIATQVRRALREGFTLLPVDLPPDFPFDEFKGVGTGAGQAIALPLQLSGTPRPIGGLQAVTQPVVGSSGFAFAVRKEYVEGLVDIEAIQQAIKRLAISVSGPLGTATYRLRFSSGPAMTFKAGAIDITGRVEVESDRWWAPDGSVEFKQAITLELVNQRVSASLLGEPEVERSGWTFRRFVSHKRAADAVKDGVDSALKSNRESIEAAFEDARQSLVDGLKNFDGSAAASYTGVQITADGVIVRGDIGTASRSAPIVEIGETDEGEAFTALQSWIPGGRIERLIWSWVEYPEAHHPLGVVQPIGWGGEVKSFTDEHRFILPKPAGVTDVSRICLRIVGSRVAPNGQVVSVDAGTTCQVPGYDVLMAVPSWWEPVTVPVWFPDLSEGAVVRGGLAGHVTVQTDVPRREGLTHNTLVYFAEWRSERPLAAVGAALSRLRRKSISLVVIVVVPPGTFDASRRELDAKVASIGARVPVRLQVTEDDDGGWTRTFAPSRIPAAYIINARREFVWKHEGDIDPDPLAAALHERLVPAPAPRFRPLRLTVAPGGRAPDAVFQDHTGQPFALHRLRGYRVLLNFWQSWSAPCLKELGRLQRLRERGGPGAPLVVAFHGGKEGRQLADIHTRFGRVLIMAQDFEQRIARAYGVRCWPTTVLVDAEGRVDHIQFGVSPDGESLPAQEELGTSY